jgi:hypothetical protein
MLKKKYAHNCRYVSHHVIWYYWKCFHHIHYPEKQTPSSSANKSLPFKHGCVRYSQFMYWSNPLSIQTRYFICKLLLAQVLLHRYTIFNRYTSKNEFSGVLYMYTYYFLDIHISNMKQKCYDKKKYLYLTSFSLP